MSYSAQEKNMNIINAKKVKTFNLEGQENGFLIELSKEGRFTTSYLSAVFPNSFKGMHLHKVREANYICIRGKVKIILYEGTERKEIILDAANPQKLNIPVNIPTGLLNEGAEEAWIINFPNPSYDPNLKGEQVDYTEEQCERGEHLMRELNIKSCSPEEWKNKWRQDRMVALDHLQAENFEIFCGTRGHRPSNVSLNECDCGFRRFDD